MVEVICDTSFLIHLATHKIKNLDSINTEIGQIQFVVPSVVLNELRKLSKTQKKKQDALKAKPVKGNKRVRTTGVIS